MVRSAHFPLRNTSNHETPTSKRYDIVHVLHDVPTFSYCVLGIAGIAGIDMPLGTAGIPPGMAIPADGIDFRCAAAILAELATLPQKACSLVLA
jgi:hypothetical protein